MGSHPLALMLAAAGMLAGCTDKDDPDGQADADGDADADADADSDADADADTEPLDVSCAATSNALRFECTVEVDPPQAVELEFARADGLGSTRTVASADALPEHVLPLYFMAPNQDYDVTVNASGSGLVTTTTVTTGAVPPDVDSTISTTVGTATFPMIGVGLPCMPPGRVDGFWNDAIATVYDTHTGDLLWYENMDPGGSFGPNDMVFFTDEHTVLGESMGDVIEVDLMGRDLVRLNGLATTFGATIDDGFFPNFHHDIVKRNGVYYVMYGETFATEEDVLDSLVLFDGTGTEIARWHSEDHLAIPVGWSGEFTLMNGIDVDAAGDLFLSIKGQDTIGKFVGDWTSPNFGQMIWLWNGPGTGQIGNTITADWSAVSPPPTFSDEHSPFFRPDGLLQILDNDDGRGLVFDVDEATQTATVVGEYEVNYPGCPPQGTSRSTLAGNPLVGCSGGRDGTQESQPNYVREYDFATGALQWEARVFCGDPGSSFNGVRWFPLEGW